MTRVMPISLSFAKVAVCLFLPKVGYCGHIFLDIDFKFVFLFIYIKINRQTKLEVHQTISKLISLGLDFGFWPHFCSEDSYRQHCGPKATLKMSGRVLAFPFNS